MQAFRLEVPKGDRRKPNRFVTRRSRRRIAVAAFVLSIGAAGAIAAVTRPLDIEATRIKLSENGTAALIALGLGVDQVSISGHHYASDREIYDALDLPNVRTFADFDAGAALKRIERIAWVSTAQITRVLPGTLKIDIRERAPAAIWQRGGRAYLIDATGRTLGDLPERSGWILPIVTGEGADLEAAGLIEALARHRDIEAKVDHAERIAERRWSVVLSGGTRIELGADREAEGLAQIASNAEVRHALVKGPVTVDVRTPGRIAIRPADGVAPARQAHVRASVPEAVR